MWSSALPSINAKESKSPLEESGKGDEDGALLCSDIFREGCSPATVSIHQEFLSPHFRSPISATGKNYIIIPLHSPQQGSLDSHILLQTNQTAVNFSPDSRSYYSVSLKSGNSAQLYRRSPEKRLSSPGPICRICHEDGQDESLISPCNCSGSLALVHKTCIEKWLSASNTDECEICKLRLPIQRQTRPLHQWFGMTGTTHGPQGFYADITCVVLLTPLCLISVYLCALGASEYMRYGVWEGTGLGILSFFLLATYLLWFYVTVRYHWRTVIQWRNANQVIQLDVKNLQRRRNIMQNSVQNSDHGSPTNSVVPALVSPSLGDSQTINSSQQLTPLFTQNELGAINHTFYESIGNDLNAVYV